MIVPPHLFFECLLQVPPRHGHLDNDWVFGSVSRPYPLSQLEAASLCVYSNRCTPIFL